MRKHCFVSSCIFIIISPIVRLLEYPIYIYMLNCTYENGLVQPGQTSLHHYLEYHWQFHGIASYAVVPL